MSKVFGGQTYKPSLFPPVKYLESLIKAYYPDLIFDPIKWRKAFDGARYPEFDAAFAAVTEDGASCNMQLCWCLLDIPAGTVLPLHAHKNLEVVYILRGTMKERTIPRALIPITSLDPQEIDYLGHADTQMVDKVYPVGTMVLYAPGSFHQVHTDKNEGCVLLVLYSKNCTFIRATAPSISRQLLAVTADKHASFAAPVVRKPSSFVNMNPRYARYRTTLSTKATTVTCAQVSFEDTHLPIVPYSQYSQMSHIPKIIKQKAYSHANCPALPRIFASAKILGIHHWFMSSVDVVLINTLALKATRLMQ
jgi:hypothetical protein